jgi:3-methyladenine DNA glycosylase/8-oxoguanine DNA glycosylase
MRTRTFRTALPVHLGQTLGRLLPGVDPTSRVAADSGVRAWLTPEGAATLALWVHDGEVTAEAHGPGADWALEQAPALVGSQDDLTGFTPQHRAVHRAHRRRPGLRLGASGLVWDTLVPTILGQKVTGREAGVAWRRIVWRHGRGPAPGPHGLRLPPAPADLAALPYEALHVCGVERRRAEVVRAAARHHGRLQEAVALPRGTAMARLTALQGIGPWTAAIVLRAATGDPDLVEVGDFHVPHQVVFDLTGRPRGTDEEMLALLEPYAGHRGRVVRLLVSAGARPPAWGPRMTPGDLRRLTPPG